MQDQRGARDLRYDVLHVDAVEGVQQTDGVGWRSRASHKVIVRATLLYRCIRDVQRGEELTVTWIFVCPAELIDFEPCLCLCLLLSGWAIAERATGIAATKDKVADPSGMLDHVIPNPRKGDSSAIPRQERVLIQHGERRRFAMSIPIPLRGDFSAAQLRGLAKKTKDGPQARRLLALAAIYEGATRTEAAKIGGVGLQIIRDWVLRFNARGADGLLDGKSPGHPCKLNDVQRQMIVRMIENGPIPAVHGVVRWRLIDLAQWVFEEFRITIAKQTLSRELRAMGYRKLSARPRHHAQVEGVIEDFKKTSSRAWMPSRARRRSTATR